MEGRGLVRKGEESKQWKGERKEGREKRRQVGV